MKIANYFLTACILLSTAGYAQQPAASSSAITIKPTPASDALNATAKDMTETAKSLDTATQQARSAFDMSVKSLNDSLSAKTKDLMDELKSDKKYAPKLKEIETIQQQQKDAISEAQKKFNASAGPLQQKVATDQALIDGLVPVVRKESGLPPTAKFDAKTQEWSTK